MQPLVSIIIPTYNRAHLIGETLDSVLAQTYKNWECIVVDDGSKDATDELLEFYCKIDSRIKYYHRPTSRLKGANTCRNYGFELSKGKYIQWLDSDDLLSDNKINSQIADLNFKTKYTIAACAWNFFSKNTSPDDIKSILPVYKSFTETKQFLDALAISGGFLPSHAYLVDSELVKKAGIWREDLMINQDGEFFSRIFVLVEEIIFSKNAYVFYRTNMKENISSLGNIDKAKQAIYSWKLITKTLEPKFGKNLKLVLISKKYLKLRLEDKFPLILEKHIDFFKEDKILKISVFVRVYRRIKKILIKK